MMFGGEVIFFHIYHYSKVLSNLQSNKFLALRLEMSQVGNSIETWTETTVPDLLSGSISNLTQLIQLTQLTHLIPLGTRNHDIQ